MTLTPAQRSFMRDMWEYSGLTVGKDEAKEMGLPRLVQAGYVTRLHFHSRDRWFYVLTERGRNDLLK